MDIKAILSKLEELKNPAAISGMARFGITPDLTFGIKMPVVRQIAKDIGRNHVLSAELWKIQYRETKILASMIADPEYFTESQMDEWTSVFDYWEICDQCVMNLFEKTSFAYEKAVECCQKKEEFVRRTGFVLMARLAVSDKKADDDKFEPFFPYIIDKATDERNLVKKAVNWALRQIGKRNLDLNRKAITVGETILVIESKSARWIARNALKELQNKSVQERLKKK